MREIIFRGMMVDGSGWVDGGIKITEVAVFIIDYNDSFIEVSPDSVSQYTGLKDKKGVKIFERDIVLLKGVKYEVYWFDNGEYRLSPHDCRNEYDKGRCIVFSKVGEIIGNTTQNPELLGG